MSVSGIELTNLLPELESLLRKKLGRVVDKATQDAASGAIVRIQDGGSKSGREYKRAGGVVHRASAPGEAPATDTGNLAAGITAQKVGELTGEVQVTAEYGPVLELGGVHIEPRPFLTPSVEAVEAPFRAACKKAFRDAAESASVSGS